MQHQNKDQAEHLVAEVLAAACLVIENDAGNAKHRGVVRRILHCAFEALRSRHISVLSQTGNLEIVLPGDPSDGQSSGLGRRIVMRKRGRHVLLDPARLKSHATFMSVDVWCKSALRSNLQRAFKILGHPEFC